MKSIKALFAIVGKYVFIESSNPRLNGDRAKLVSAKWLQPVSLTSATCLQFYYHMHGHTMGSVRVYIQYVEMDEPTLIWSMSGDQGHSWQKAKVSLNAVKPFKVGERDISESHSKDN